MAHVEQNGTKTSGNTKLRSYFMTINNPMDVDKAHLLDADKYAFQYEAGENGTRHIQAYVYYKNAISFTSMKKRFPRAHIEKVKSIPDAIKYCTKEETRLEGPFIKGLIIPKNEKPKLSKEAKEIRKEINPYWRIFFTNAPIIHCNYCLTNNEGDICDSCVEKFDLPENKELVERLGQKNLLHSLRSCKTAVGTE